MSTVRCLQIFLHAVKRDEPELTRALGSEDVIFIKGPFLSKRFYGDPGFRHCGDIDLLVRGRGDVMRSAGVLREAGSVRRSIPLLGHGAVWEDFFERRRHEGVLKISATVLDLTLDLLACREDFSQLASSFLRHGDLVKGGLMEPIDFLQWSGSNRDKWSGRNRDKLRNHIWTFRLHEGGDGAIHGLAAADRAVQPGCLSIAPVPIKRTGM